MGYEWELGDPLEKTKQRLHQTLLRAFEWHWVRRGNNSQSTKGRRWSWGIKYEGKKEEWIFWTLLAFFAVLFATLVDMAGTQGILAGFRDWENRMSGEEGWRSWSIWSTGDRDRCGRPQQMVCNRTGDETGWLNLEEGRKMERSPVWLPVSLANVTCGIPALQVLKVLCHSRHHSPFSPV